MKKPDAHVEWMDHRAARRMYQAAHRWRPSDDEADRWVFDKAAHGRIRTKPGDDGGALAEMFALHRAGEPGMHQTYFVLRAPFAAADMNSALKEEKLGRSPKTPGRKPHYPFSAWIAELLDSNTPGPIKRESVIASLEREEGRV